MGDGHTRSVLPDPICSAEMQLWSADHDGRKRTQTTIPAIGDPGETASLAAGLLENPSDSGSEKLS